MNVRRLIFLAGLILVLLPLSLWAQTTPQAEVFAGYSYVRAGGGPPDINLHGIDFSAAGNVNSTFGIVADIGYYRSSGFIVPVNAVSYLFGPRISYRGNEKVTPFFQTLYGGVRTSAAGTSDNMFAMTVGGGIDVTVHPSVAIRVAQAEYLLTRSNGVSTSNFRFAAGVVFRIGSK